LKEQQAKNQTSTSTPISINYVYKKMKTEAPRPIDRVISFALYAGLGITTEVFFTAISDLIISASFEDLSLKGYSYIWMFPIYGSTSILFPFFFGMMKKWPRLARYAFYGVGIFIR